MLPNAVHQSPLDLFLAVRTCYESTPRFRSGISTVEGPIPGDLNLVSFFEFLKNENSARYRGQLISAWVSKENDINSMLSVSLTRPSISELSKLFGVFFWLSIKSDDDVPITSPIETPSSQSLSTETPPERDAFALMMTASIPTPFLLPDPQQSSQQYNDLMQELKREVFSNIFVTPKCLSPLMAFRKAYADAIWLLSGQSKKFKDRAIPLPHLALSLIDRSFRQIQEKSSKKGTQVLTAGGLLSASNALKDAKNSLLDAVVTQDLSEITILMRGEISRYRVTHAKSIFDPPDTKFQVFLRDAIALSDSLLKYANYLQSACQNQQTYRDSVAQFGPRSLLPSDFETGVDLDSSPNKQPLDPTFLQQVQALNDFDILEFPDRAHPAEFRFPSPIAWTRANLKSRIGWKSLIIKLPADIQYSDPRIDLALQRTMNELNPKRIPASTISGIASQHRLRPSAVRSMFNQAGCQTRVANEATKIADAKYLRSLQGLDAAASCVGSEDGSDLTLLQEHLHRSRYEEFFRCLAEYLEAGSIGANSRRRPNEAETTLTSSVKELKACIVQKYNLTPSQVPSSEYIRLHFRPPMISARTASRYYCAYPIRFLTIARSVHQDHADLHYVNSLQLLFRTYAQKLNALTFACDDKATILCGGPGVPEAPIIRPQPTLQMTSSPLQASDHDYESACKITASVIFQMTDPLSEPYRGLPYVNIKSKAFHGSSAIRHAHELKNLVSTTCSPDSPPRPIFLLTDGGPDHNVTHMSVKLSLIWLWLKTNTPLLVAIRLCPGNSYRNPAERLMSRLNMALSTVALERVTGSEPFETKLGRAYNLDALRQLGEEDPDFLAEYLECLSPAMTAITTAFNHCTWKGKSFQSKVLTDDISFDHTTDLPFSLPPDIKKVERQSSFRLFCRNHVYSTAYSFQIRNCLNSSCEICRDRDGDPLPFLPMPTTQETDSSDIPIRFDSPEQVISNLSTVSSLGQEAPSTVVKEASIPRAFSANRARTLFFCAECDRPRLLYPIAEHLSDAEKAQLRERSTTGMRCGHSDDHVMTFVSSCANAIELQLYRIVRSPTAHDYPSLSHTTLKPHAPPCIHCGVAVKSQPNWSVEPFFPQCQGCVDQSKETIRNTLRQCKHPAKLNRSISDVFGASSSSSAESHDSGADRVEGSSLLGDEDLEITSTLSSPQQNSLSTLSVSAASAVSVIDLSTEYEDLDGSDWPLSSHSPSNAIEHASASVEQINDDEMNIFCQELSSQVVMICSTFFFPLCQTIGTGAHRIRALEKAWKTVEENKLCERVLVPCCFDNHWVLCCISLRPSPSISFFDSARGHLFSRREEVSAPFCEFLKVLNIQISTITWVDSPQQSNNVDCGVFVMSFLRHLVRHPDLPLGDFSAFELLSRENVPQRSRGKLPHSIIPLIFPPKKRSRPEANAKSKQNARTAKLPRKAQ